MDPLKRKALASDLQAQVAEIAADIRAQLLMQGPPRDRARELHRDERVGDDFEVWLDLLSRRAAVLWVLKTVYVRVLEDRGFLQQPRLCTRDSQALFQRLTPDLGDTAFLRWIFKDLAASGGLPELFTLQPAEIGSPSNALSKRLLDFWRREDEATGQLVYRFSDEHFDGRLMGDLYQDLDPVVKERYALLQTPEPVVEFMLDETLTPAIDEFGIDAVRVLDPACGSGHFLLAAFKRIVKAMRSKHPAMPSQDVVRSALERVVGIDLNDYACALARARLVMTALEEAGEDSLSSGSIFHPNVYWADGLEQVERDEQVELEGLLESTTVASLTRPVIRHALRPILKAGFHVVVANPPYIAERDPDRRAYHRELIGRSRRYVSASGKYSLGNPFTERMFQLALPQGYIGNFNGNSFMKREFGKALIEQVLSRQDLFKVVDLGGARFEGYGTPTVILFARRRAPTSSTVTVIMGKKGDPPGRPGMVWASTMAGHRTPGYEDEYVTVGSPERASLRTHPWSIGGGGASDLKLAFDGCALQKLSSVAFSIGISGVTGEDDVFRVADERTADRLGMSPIRGLIVGDGVRDWQVRGPDFALWPYADDFKARLLEDIPAVGRYLWKFRTSISRRRRFGVPMIDRGLRWYEWQELYTEKLQWSPSIVWAEVATHNQYALDSSTAIPNRTAPTIKLPSNASEGLIFAVLGVLNSSSSCFWMKQVCQHKGGSGVGRGVQSEPWMERYQFGATKLEEFPLPPSYERCAEYARTLDSLARERARDSAQGVIANAAAGASSLLSALRDRRSRDQARLAKMVAIQEELDWLCYRLFGVDPDGDEKDIRAPSHMQAYRPGLRPFEISLARDNADRREKLARGEEPEEAPSAWFERHNLSSDGGVENLPEVDQRIARSRMARTGASRELAILEQPAFKRRWFVPDYDAADLRDLQAWLEDQLEDWAKTLPGPFSIDEATVAFQARPDVLAVTEVLCGRPDFNLHEVLAALAAESSVPNQKHHVFTEAGLTKRNVWERTWDEQRAADSAASAGVKTALLPAPPEYSKGDYLRDSYWSARGRLDVPRERFIALTEVPGRPEALFAWSGLSARKRARMLVELDEHAERTGISREDRIGLLSSIWSLAALVAWESEAASNEYRAAVTAVVGQAGVTDDLLADWASRHPAPQQKRGTTKPKQRKADQGSI